MRLERASAIGLVWVCIWDQGLGESGLGRGEMDVRVGPLLTSWSIWLVEDRKVQADL